MCERLHLCPQAELLGAIKHTLRLRRQVKAETAHKQTHTHTLSLSHTHTNAAVFWKSDGKFVDAEEAAVPAGGLCDSYLAR